MQSILLRCASRKHVQGLAETAKLQALKLQVAVVLVTVTECEAAGCLGR
jgi:hypothetical protein